MKLRLHTFWRSSAAYRVRIALHLKGLNFDSIAVGLRGQEHRRPEYLELNPQGLVPLLEVDGRRIGQSLAIIEYLDEREPSPPLLPPDPFARAIVRSMALVVACEIHPLNNLRVLDYLKCPLGRDEQSVNAWYRRWVEEGFRALEELAGTHSGDGRHLFGSAVTLADVCLVPQVYNARRFACPLDAFPRLLAIATSLDALPAFRAARPEIQADAH